MGRIQGRGLKKVTNGDFSDGTTGWATSGEAAIIDSATLVVSSGGLQYISNTGLDLVNTKTYKITFTATRTVGTGNLEFGYNSGLSVSSSPEIDTSGVQTIYFKPTYNSTNFGFKSKTASGNYTWIIDNVSIKAINDKHHATTVFYGDDISDVAQGTFTGGALTGWSLIGSASDTTGGADYADITSSGSSNELIRTTSNFTTVVGRTYRVTFDRVTGTGVSRCYVDTSTETVSGDSSTAGTYTLDFVATATGHKVGFRANTSSVRCFIDNVKVSEVGVASGWTDADQQLHIPQTALQSYNELAWSDGNANVKVEVASLAADLGSSDFSISHVLSPNNITGNNTYLAFNVGSSDGRVIHRIDDEVVEIYIEDSNANTASYEAGSGAGAIKAGQTYHIVEVFDRAADLVTVYINGVASGTTIDISSLNGDIDCNGALGFYKFSSDPAIEGFITEVALWKNTKLDATEVLELYNDGKPLDALTHTKASTLYGYWRNNGLSTWVNLANPGTKDSTTNTLTETILIPQGVDSTRDAQGFIMNRQKSTSCLNLTEGSDEAYVLVKNNPTLQFASGGSVGFWMKPKGTPPGTGYCILNNGVGGSRNPRITLQSDLKINFFWEIADGTNKDTDATSAVTEGEWTYVVCTWDGTTNKIYYNDALDKSEAESGTPDTDTADLYIGKDQTGSDGNFKGYLDGITFYSDVLSLEEVQRNYNATKGNHRN
jgi:hypothetical protein